MSIEIVDPERGHRSFMGRKALWRRGKLTQGRTEAAVKAAGYYADEEGDYSDSDWYSRNRDQDCTEKCQPFFDAWVSSLPDSKLEKLCSYQQDAMNTWMENYIDEMESVKAKADNERARAQRLQTNVILLDEELSRHRRELAECGASYRKLENKMLLLS